MVWKVRKKMSKTTKMIVDVPLGHLDELTKKELDRLRRENRRLKTKNEKLMTTLSESKRIVDKAKNIIEAVKEAGEFYDSDNFDW